MRTLAWAAILSVQLSGCSDDGTSGTPSATDTGTATGGTTASDDTAAPQSDGSTADDAAPGESTSTPDDSSSGGIGQLPTPCDETTVLIVESEHEPNDTPAQAVDLCTKDVIGSWTVSGELGGDDTVDYFIFSAAQGVGVVPFSLEPCWEPAMDFVLYEVVDGELQVFWEASTDDAGCADVPGGIPANRLYVLRISGPDDASLPPGSTYNW